MITLKDFMEAVNYRITEGSDYTWNCFGDRAYRLDSWDGEQEGVTIGIVFDTNTQVVYQMEAHDYSGRRSYRWTHPDYRKAHDAETAERMGSDYKEFAYDEVPYTELDVAEDMLKKAHAIARYEPYDTRVQVPFDFEDHELFQLMKMAHERDITLNKMIEEILNEAINRAKVDTEIK